MDPTVSNFAHRAYGIMLNQLSPWFYIDVLCLQGHSVMLLQAKWITVRSLTTVEKVSKSWKGKKRLWEVSAALHLFTILLHEEVT